MAMHVESDGTVKEGEVPSEANHRCTELVSRLLAVAFMEPDEPSRVIALTGALFALTKDKRSKADVLGFVSKTWDIFPASEIAMLLLHARLIQIRAVQGVEELKKKGLL